MYSLWDVTFHFSIYFHHWLPPVLLPVWQKIKIAFFLNVPLICAPFWYLIMDTVEGQKNKENNSHSLSEVSKGKSHLSLFPLKNNPNPFSLFPQGRFFSIIFLKFDLSKSLTSKTQWKLIRNPCPGFITNNIPFYNTLPEKILRDISPNSSSSKEAEPAGDDDGRPQKRQHRTGVKFLLLH